MNSNEILRSLTNVVDAVPSGIVVSLEGVPLYMGQPWTPIHEFGTNVLLPQTRGLLEGRECSVRHVEMVDDFTTNQRGNGREFIAQMADNPMHVYFESEFAQEAEDIARFLEREGKTINVQGERLLARGSMPKIRTRSGRVSCELLDACFQRRKGSDANIIFHPKSFIQQQEGMRTLLHAINGNRLPGSFVNIFLKNNSISTILHTDIEGRSRRIQ